MNMKMTVFWGVTPCGLVEVYRRFGGAYCLHHQGVAQTTRRRRSYQRPAASRARQSLQVIAEDADHQHTRRRKQLIPRARLVHHKRRSPPAPRARPLLLTPPPDFRTDDRCIPPSDLTAALPWGATIVRRKGSSHKKVTRVAINDGSNRKTVNENITNSATKRHKIINESTEETIQISIGETQDAVQDSGDETTKLSPLSANADIKGTEDSSGTCAKRNQGPTETSVKKTPGPAAESVKTAQSDTGGSSNRTPDLISDSVRSESANKIQHSGTDSPTNLASRRGCDKIIEDPTDRSGTTFKNFAGQSAKIRQDSTGETERRSQDKSTRQNNVYGHLGKNSWPVQYSTGYTVETWSRSSSKGFSKTRDSQEGRKTEDCVNTTSSRTCKNVRGIDTADRLERKIGYTVCAEGHKKGIYSEGFRTEIRPAAIQKTQESSGDKDRKALYNADGKEDYTASEKRKRAHSSGATTKQVSEDKGVQQSSTRKVKKIDGRPISSDKDTRNEVIENKNTIGNQASSEDKERQDSAQNKTEEVVQVALQGAMSRRPQVMRITDSATTACRPRAGDKQDVVRVGQEESLDPESEGSCTNGTRKLRSIFEGGRETTSPPKATGIVPEMLPTSGDTTKPILIATLPMEKPPSRTKINSPPDENAVPKTAAFREFSCNDQEKLCTISRSVSDDHSSLHKVAAFDGLLQYLQDYKNGLRELLVNNNVVIIEPVRQSTARLKERKSASESTCRITGTTVKNSSSTSASNTLPRQQPILRRHFFYHPVRSNRELVDEELPDPDKVRHAREIFERTMKMKDTMKEEFSNANVTINTNNNIRNLAAKTTDISKSEKVKRRYLTEDTVFRHNVLHKRWTDSGSLSSGVSSDLSCCETDVESADTFSRREEPTDTFSSDDDRNESDEGHYVAPEVLERIRACGTTVTYYGGQVIAASDGPVRSPITLAIMDEIQKSKDCSKKGQGNRITQDEYLGVKFRLVKSNSCGSRLELAGTEDEDSWKKEDNCEDEQKVSDETENEDEGKEHTQQSSATVCRNSVFPTVNEGRSIFDHTNTYDRVRAPKMCFSPEKSKLLERGSNVLFDDMEFEEFEIAEDSLTVIEEQDIECNSSDEDGVRQVDLRDGNAVSVTGAAVEKQSNNSEEMSKSSTSKANGDVQMTTWASRSVLFDLKNCENGGSAPTQISGPNHSSC